MKENNIKMGLLEYLFVKISITSTDVFYIQFLFTIGPDKKQANLCPIKETNPRLSLVDIIKNQGYNIILVA